VVLALGMIENAIAKGLPHGIVLADCDYGNKTAFRDALDTMGLQYAVDVQSMTMVSTCDGRQVVSVTECPSVRSALLCVRSCLRSRCAKARKPWCARGSRASAGGRSRRRPDEGTTVVGCRVA
jgi:hypothetical protein